MTKQEWVIVQEKLQCLYSPVAIMCDGYHVMLRLERISILRNAICVYVNGFMKHYPEGSQERLRFMYPSKRSVMSAKDKRELAKEPKWLQKQLKKNSRLFDPTATFTTYIPWWGSFKALKSHLVKHNQEIELLKTWKYETKSEAQS